MKYKNIVIISLSMIICFIVGFGSVYGYCKYREQEIEASIKTDIESKKEENNDVKEEDIYIKDSPNDEMVNKKEKPKKEINKDKQNKKEKVKKDEDKKLDSEEKLKNEEKNWYYVPVKGGRTPEGPEEAMEYNKKYGGYYLGDTKRKVIYLTFDEGYENGYTSKILDTLKKNGVKATFFVTKTFIIENPLLVKRMYNEGHIVGNHSVKHQSMASIAANGLDGFKREFIEVEEAYKKVIGKDMPKYFRPPMGKYSEKSMSYTDDLGYKTIFWSFAYNDYEEDKQPEINYAQNLIMERTHNGGIYLLHAISKTNADALEWILKEWKKQGYEFETIDKI